jgi:hypothetical protein
LPVHKNMNMSYWVYRHKPKKKMYKLLGIKRGKLLITW